MSKHTPGPWHVLGPDSYADRCQCIDITNDGNTLSVAFAVADVDYGITLEVEANAKLIAAAPDMAEALKKVMSRLRWAGWAGEGENERGDATFTGEDFDAVKAALSKAGIS